MPPFRYYSSSSAVSIRQITGTSRFAPSFAWEADDFVPFLYQAKPPRSEKEAGLGAR